MLGLRGESVFLGQAVAASGTAMSPTFSGVSRGKLIEMPVAEDMQLGMSIGMALAGLLPICVYPRINFLLLAVNQLVLHLDKLPVYSAARYKPRVIIRTAVATPHPLDPGAQHLGDFSDALELMLTTVKIVRLNDADRIVPEYQAAAERECSTLLIEYTGAYA